MSAILIRPNNEYYIIEVVKNLNRSMPVDVTSNPVETGVTIADHLTLQNKTWTIEGVISDATFSFYDDQLNWVPGMDATVIKTQGFHVRDKVFVTTNRSGVGTELGGGTSLTEKLKSAAGKQLGFLTQFFKTPIKVDVEVQGNSYQAPKYEVTNGTREANKAYDKYRLLEEIRDKREVLTLVHSSGTFDNLVITNVEPVRNASTSVHSFVFTLSLQQIQIVDKAKTVAIAKAKPRPKAAPKPAAATADQCTGKADNGKGSTKNAGLLADDPTVWKKFVEDAGDLGGLVGSL